MTPPPPRKDSETMDAEVREKIHLEILKRTGAYHANDHILLPSGQHTTEYIDKTLFTLVSRDFPTYAPETCPLCKKGMPLNREFVKRRDERKPSTAEEDDE